MTKLLQVVAQKLSCLNRNRWQNDVSVRKHLQSIPGNNLLATGSHLTSSMKCMNILEIYTCNSILVYSILFYLLSLQIVIFRNMVMIRVLDYLYLFHCQLIITLVHRPQIAVQRPPQYTQPLHVQYTPTGLLTELLLPRRGCLQQSRRSSTLTSSAIHQTP